MITSAVASRFIMRRSIPAKATGLWRVAPPCDNLAMVKLVHLFAAVAVAGSLAACSSVATPSSETTEVFTGTLDPLGQAFQTFSVSKTGELQVTLQSLAPRPVVGFIALAVGAPASGVCSPLAGYVVQQAAIGQQYAFPQISKGNYCLLEADAAGILTAQTTFTVRVLHP
jgi:hypothetical protein